MIAMRGQCEGNAVVVLAMVQGEEEEEEEEEEEVVVVRFELQALENEV
jgi:hypothetical protein